MHILTSLNTPLLWWEWNSDPQRHASALEFSMIQSMSNFYQESARGGVLFPSSTDYERTRTQNSHRFSASQHRCSTITLWARTTKVLTQMNKWKILAIFYFLRLILFSYVYIYSLQEPCKVPKERNRELLTKLEQNTRTINKTGRQKPSYTIKYMNHH